MSETVKELSVVEQVASDYKRRIILTGLRDRAASTGIGPSDIADEIRCQFPQASYPDLYELHPVHKGKMSGFTALMRWIPFYLKQ